jgi:hypothetical protein
MKAKGSFFAGRRSFIVQQFGEARWNAFIDKLAKTNPTFKSPILPTTTIPIDDYIAFNESLIAELFAGNTRSYWTFGEKAGEWALTEGPYKHFRNNSKTVDELVKKLPLIWSAYFTDGELVVSLNGREIDARLVDLPVWHLSFEYATMGFLKRAVELAGASTVTPHRLEGVSAGQKAIHYRFTF